MTNEPLILLIEDEAQVRRFLRVTLNSHGYRLVEAETADEGIRQATTRAPDVILLDLGLPDRDGLEVLEAIRGWSDMPVIVLSARGQEDDKIRALDEGADDYLTKPFGAGELLARIRVALRHHREKGSATASPIYEVEDVTVDLAARRVLLRGEEVHLTPIEYNLLAILIRNAGKVVTHSQLLKEVWGPRSQNQTQYLRVYMKSLRHKLEKDPARPRIFLNEPGIGYRLKTE